MTISVFLPLIMTISVFHNDYLSITISVFHKTISVFLIDYLCIPISVFLIDYLCIPISVFLPLIMTISVFHNDYGIQSQCSSDQNIVIGSASISLCPGSYIARKLKRDIFFFRYFMHSEVSHTFPDSIML